VAFDTFWQVGIADWSLPGSWSNGRPGGEDNAYINNGGTARITQTNEQCYCLCLGQGAGESGTAEISGTGQLQAYRQEVGYEGVGAFIQTGGAHLATMLELAREPSSHGSYQLADGGLLAESEWIGIGGTGTFTQTGGTNIVTDFIQLGLVSGAYGTYNLTGGTHAISTWLELGDLAGSSGNYNLGGAGRLSAQAERMGFNGAGTFTQTGGTNEITDELYLGYGPTSTGTYTIGGGSLSVPNLYVGHYGSGLLNITGTDADITVSNKLKFAAASTLTAVPGSTIHMAGASLENENTDPTDLADLANLTLIFEGGTADVDFVEVASEDNGPVLDAWSDNLVLGTLQLGGLDPGRIQLVDNFDNQVGWAGPEAMYVNTIIPNAGANINLNGINLYYLNGGDPKQFFMSDADLDGKVDIFDLNALAANWGTGSGWAEGDFNGDLTADIFDLDVMATNWGSGTFPATVPEPIVLTLLALGALGVLRRRP